jgi:cobalt-precorrin-5B (C1)-methyltransferase
MVESDYSRQTVKRGGMRTGYTTGSSAAAAAKAATQSLLTGELVHQSTIQLPIGRSVTFDIHRCQPSDDGTQVTCSVIKDGGDDPDATHGAEICATVSLDPDAGSGVRITGGPGVGTVTRPGTGIEVGEPAVTRVPRRMIIESVTEAVEAYFNKSNEVPNGPSTGSGRTGDAAETVRGEVPSVPGEVSSVRGELVEPQPSGSHALPSGTGIIVEISVPGGEEIAEKTTNSRLGILGGISILGSTGVVQPFSTAAWRASANLAVDVAATNNLSHLVLSTGTQSEAFTKQILDLPDMAYIEAGIFSGASMKRCVMRNVKRATHAGMVGKFSKMAMGYFVTHVAGNRVDTSFLASLAAQCGATDAVQEEIRQAASARHFQELALANGLGSVFTLICELVCEESRKLLGDDADKLIIDSLCFDFDGALLGQASTSPDGIPLTAIAGRPTDG